MNLPEVTDTSATSREAVRFIAQLLPGSWTTSSPEQGDDYGCDLDISISELKQATGRRAHLQVKGTRKLGSASRSVRIKSSTLEYLRAHADIGLVARVQVDEKRIWLTHVFDARTHAAPAEDGYVYFTFTDHDEVQADQLAVAINGHSYRKRLANGSLPFLIATNPPRAAIALHSRLSGRALRGLTFTPSMDPTLGAFQARLHFSADNKSECVLVDIPTRREYRFRLDPFPCFVLDLSLYLAANNGDAIAASLFLSCGEMFSEGDLGALPINDINSLLLACEEHGGSNIPQFVAALLSQPKPWVGQWVSNLILKGLYTAESSDFPAIARCFEPSFQTSLLLTRLMLISRHLALAESTLNATTPSPSESAHLYFEYAQFCEHFGRYEEARRGWFLAARNGYDRLACHLEIARSFLLDRRVSDTLRFTPRSGVPKDVRCRSLLSLLTFLRDVLSPASRDGREDFDAMLDHNDVIVEIITRLDSANPADPIETSDTVPNYLTKTAFMLIAGLRANEQASAKTWGIVIAFGIRAHVPTTLINAVINLAAPVHGGEPLRLAIQLLGSHPDANVLAQWHLVADDLQGVQLTRRTEDFVGEKPGSR